MQQNVNKKEFKQRIKLKSGKMKEEDVRVGVVKKCIKNITDSPLKPQLETVWNYGVTKDLEALKSTHMFGHVDLPRLCGKVMSAIDSAMKLLLDFRLRSSVIIEVLLKIYPRLIISSPHYCQTKIFHI